MTPLPLSSFASETESHTLNDTSQRRGKRKQFAMRQNLLSDSLDQDASNESKRGRSDRGCPSVNIRITLESKPLPDPKEDVKPTVFLQDLVESLYGYRPEVKTASTLKGYFPEVSEDQIAAYDMNVLNAARDDDLQRLKGLYESGQTMDCCNRFGESLLHLVCRRGFEDVALFLLVDVELKVRICDDCGRNPFHDICWNPTAQIEIAKLLLERDPTLLLIGDKRGHTPFDYARPEDWQTWRDFLFEHRSYLEPLQEESTRLVFSVTKE